MPNPFSTLGASVTVTAPNGSASATATLPGSGGGSVRVYNATTVPVAFRVGAGAQVAITTDTFIAPGLTEIFSISPGATDVSAFGIGGTGTVYFQRGDGA